MLDQVDAPRANILIVDDTPANLSLLSQMFAKQGYQVRPVPDGPLALTAAQAEPPDLVLLDIRMPDMDGYEVCEHLKAHPQTRDIPIIFVSALEDIKDKVKAFTAGGVDYVTKPFQVEEVLARVATHLALRDLQTQLERANQELTRQLTET
ncbi:MAG: response regulator, partial [Chloroflexi bacterium]|nr:response regulator [Chloroflexota bacterium]